MVARADDEIDIDELAQQVARKLQERRREVEESATWAGQFMPLAANTFLLIERALDEDEEATQVFRRAHIRRSLRTLGEGMERSETLLVQTEVAWYVERHARDVARQAMQTELPAEDVQAFHGVGADAAREFEAARRRAREAGFEPGRFARELRETRNIVARKEVEIGNEEVRPRRKWFKGLGKISVGILTGLVDVKFSAAAAPVGLLSLLLAIEKFTDGCGDLRGE